jgi:recombination protein RecA
MAENMTLQDVLKKIKKDFGDSVVKVGVESLDVDGILSLGSPSFDFCIYGGIPEGRIVEFSGPESSGKTTTAFLTAASYQREEIKRNPKNPRSIVYLDNEGTADPIWAKKMGYDMGENAKVSTILIRPEAQSAEQIFDMAISMLKTGEIGLLVFDSIATLVPQQIAEESMEKKQMGGISTSLTRFANSIVGVLRKYKATLIGINQVRENLSGYGDFLITPGGRAWKHQCSVRLMFKRGDFFDENGEVVKKTANSPAGNIIEVAVLKTKVCKWDRKLGYMHLNYDRGVDILEDTLDVATHFGFIDNSVQGSYILLDTETGKIMKDKEGKEIKIRGRKNLRPFFDGHPELWKKLYKKVYDKLRIKEDANIVAFEKMLNTNIEERFGINLEKESE